jgi:hypothetical protein
MWYCNIGSRGGRWAHERAPVISPEELDRLREDLLKLGEGG